MDISSTILDIDTIFYEEGALDTRCGREITSKFKNAEFIPVDSHWLIDCLNKDESNIDKWNRIKRNTLVVGKYVKNRYCRRNCRSTDFIAPSHANGCALACNYCYVARRKGYANPITVFTDIDRWLKYMDQHISKQGAKTEPNQCHPTLWTYDIGENNDCSIDDLISSNIKDIIEFFANSNSAMASFATKYVNKNLLDYDPKGHARVRFSMMPHEISKIVDIKASTISDRLNVVNDFVEAGYEVHFNFSPIIIYDDWEDDWSELLREIDDVLSEKAKRQLKAEVIFLTHNANLHELNMKWHPIGEDYLWQPHMQQRKLSQNGMWNIRYRNNWKRHGVETITKLINNYMPYCTIRYAF